MSLGSCHISKFYPQYLSDLINEWLEVYIDDFTPYGDDFDPALDTLENVLQRYIATRLCLSHEKCYMMMAEGLSAIISQQLAYK